MNNKLNIVALVVAGLGWLVLLAAFLIFQDSITALTCSAGSVALVSTIAIVCSNWKD